MINRLSLSVWVKATVFGCAEEESGALPGTGTKVNMDTSTASAKEEIQKSELVLLAEKERELFKSPESLNLEKLALVSKGKAYPAYLIEAAGRMISTLPRELEKNFHKQGYVELKDPKWFQRYSSGLVERQTLGEDPIFPVLNLFLKPLGLVASSERVERWDGFLDAKYVIRVYTR